MSQTLNKALPRNAAWASTAGAIKGKQMSALYQSSGKKPFANLKPRNQRMMRISQAKADGWTDQYYKALDKKWATKDAWTGFWRGDEDRGIEGRNDAFNRYLKEWRYKYNKAMCD